MSQHPLSKGRGFGFIATAPFLKENQRLSIAPPTDDVNRNPIKQ